MIEDKLEHDERVRLEALSQAIIALGSRYGDPSSSLVIQTAMKFENYIKGK